MIISCFKPSYKFDSVFDTMYASENVFQYYEVQYLKDCICVICGKIIPLWSRYALII